ncbi:MAG TPA: hypothetical protein VFK36_14745 [Gemmatimonadales bacterium]|nr:hypothetical protein [Gemmatimonadales bacterium]
MRTIFILSLLLTACSTTELHAPASGGLIEGSVLTSQGEPVAKAMVTAVAYRAPFAPVLAQDSMETGDDGRFRITLSSSELLDADAVVTLTVRPPASAPLVGMDTSAVAVHFTPASPPTDTTRLSFHLRYKPD